MTYLHFICIGHHVESGVSAWFGSTLCLVFDHGKSTLCLVFDNLSWAQGRLTPCLVLMVGSVTWDYIQSESHGFELIGGYLVLLKQSGYRRLSIALK